MNFLLKKHCLFPDCDGSGWELQTDLCNDRPPFSDVSQFKQKKHGSNGDFYSCSADNLDYDKIYVSEL